MKKILLSLGFVLMGVSSASNAVDGYKDLKFGSSFAEVKAMKPCTLQPYVAEDLVKGITQYYCSDFKFSGSNTSAMFFFIHDKFERVGIALKGNVGGVFDALKAKYGVPSSQSSSDEFDSMEKNGGTVYIRFDNNSIIMAQTKNTDGVTDLKQLIYTSLDYEDKYQALKENAVSNDI